VTDWSRSTWADRRRATRRPAGGPLRSSDPGRDPWPSRPTTSPRRTRSGWENHTPAWGRRRSTRADQETIRDRYSGSPRTLTRVR
jgi:hypothetical protein